MIGFIRPQPPYLICFGLSVASFCKLSLNASAPHHTYQSLLFLRVPLWSGNHVLAFCTILARQLILLWWKHLSPPALVHWLRDVTLILYLKKTRFTTSYSLFVFSLFHTIWFSGVYLFNFTNLSCIVTYIFSVNKICPLLLAGCYLFLNTHV